MLTNCIYRNAHLTVVSICGPLGILASCYFTSDTISMMCPKTICTENHCLVLFWLECTLHVLNIFSFQALLPECVSNFVKSVLFMAVGRNAVT